MSYVHHIWISLIAMAVQSVLSSFIVFYFDCTMRCESISIGTVGLALTLSAFFAGLCYAALTRLVYGAWPRPTGLISGVVVAVVCTSLLAGISATTGIDGLWAITVVMIAVLTLGYGWLKLWGSIPPKVSRQPSNSIRGSAK